MYEGMFCGSLTGESPQLMLKTTSTRSIVEREEKK
jgi:hypothetical protein